MSIRQIGVGLFLIVSAFAMGLFELEMTPPLWWDEGWTLCVARQWVETGHYGCLLEGQPAPPILAGHFPVVASVTAGFHLFGVGVWQARLVELFYTFGALGFLYFLTARLYSHDVALGTLALQQHRLQPVQQIQDRPATRGTARQQRRDASFAAQHSEQTGCQ